jgi:cytochrome c553
MQRSVGVTLLCVLSFAAGAAVQHLYERRAVAPEVARAPAPDAISVVDRSATVDFSREPLWAYGFLQPPKPGDRATPQAPPSRNLRPNEDATEQTRSRQLPGSPASYSLVDIRDGGNVADWYAQDHPPMPDIIRLGPAKMTTGRRGCGFCHLPNGLGRPENAPTAALPPAYFVQQLRDFRSGLRRSADPRKPNTNTMADLARAMTDEEMRQAAEYFAAVKWSPRVKVIETSLAPKTRIVGNLFLATEKGRSEPIAGRIIEVPEEEERSETLRDPRSGFIAYVPEGSLARGKHLVTLGGAQIVDNAIIQGKTTACTACHAPDLMGVGDVPPIAGRSPSYIVRQLFDIQQGTRNGPGVELMKVVVAKLTPDDMTSIGAYVASKFPPDPVDVEEGDAVREEARFTGQAGGQR